MSVQTETPNSATNFEPESKKYVEVPDDIAKRISDLSQSVKDLRLVVTQERLHLQREIRLSSWWLVFNAKQQRYLQDRRRWRCDRFVNRVNMNAARHRSAFTDFHPVVQPFDKADLNSAWSTCLVNLYDATSQLEVDRNLSQKSSFTSPKLWKQASMWSEYKQKIFDLEMDCCTGLNKIRSKFVESLQNFGDSYPLNDVSLSTIPKADLHAYGDHLEPADEDDELLIGKADSIKKTDFSLDLEQIPFTKPQSVNDVQTLWTANDDRKPDGDLNNHIQETQSSKLLPEQSKLYDSDHTIDDFTLLESCDPPFTSRTYVASPSALAM